MRQTLLLSKAEIEKILSMDEVLTAVERAFKLQAQGETMAPPKLYLDLPEYQGDFRAMPAYIEGGAGVKWVSVYPNNRDHNLPTVIATIILCEPSTSYPLAIMDGTHITGMRTGAAGGVAVKWLARKGSSVIGMIGASTQAKTQLMAVKEVLPGIKEVKVFDQYKEISVSYAEEMGAKLSLNIRPTETVEQALEADIVVTTTPSREPVVKKELIRPGTHINAIGADAQGKQELEAGLLKRAKVVVDEMNQACHSGEINVPISQGMFKPDDVYGTLGEVVAGMKAGRQSEQEITIFDSTGLAIQDIVCANLVYERVKKGRFSTFKFL